jgi:hypothetical protein
LVSPRGFQIIEYLIVDGFDREPHPSSDVVHSIFNLIEWRASGVLRLVVDRKSLSMEHHLDPDATVLAVDRVFAL